MIRILNAEPSNYCDEARQILRSIGEVDERYLDREGLLRCLDPYDALIVRLGFQVDREMIDAGRSLKAIVTATTGLDHIDVEYARNKGIVVLSLRGEREFLRSIPATAEHTWTLLLALIRRVPWAYRSVLAGNWDRDAFRGRELRGKRLGIVGLGRVGRQVARYGLAFGMRVYAYDSDPKARMAGVEISATLTELLGKSDVLSVHVPLNQETVGLIGEEELALLPPGAVLVNTSRGAIVREQALLAALEQGRLAGAALDVLPDEREQDAETREAFIAYARTHGNLLMTPHIGGATVESMRETEVFMAKKLKRHFESITIAQAVRRSS